MFYSCNFSIRKKENGWGIDWKGIFISVFPFLLPDSQIINYQIKLNTLILKREGKREFKINVEPNDVKNTDKFISQLQIRNCLKANNNG